VVVGGGFVTRQGDVLAKKGAITGGHRDERTSRVVLMKAIRRCKQQLADVQKRIGAAEGEAKRRGRHPLLIS
jgi:chromosome segregation ATPase